MLDRMYKEYPAGEAPERLDRLARKQLQTHAAQQLHPVRVTSSALARPLVRVELAKFELDQCGIGRRVSVRDENCAGVVMRTSAE
jgi:hypothetical protein